MWLPAPLYRRAPFYWMLIGVLLTIVGTVGMQQIDLFAGLACLASGIASCFWSLHIALDRRSRKQPEVEIPLDQTCELSYRPDRNPN